MQSWFRAHPEALRRTTPLADWGGVTIRSPAP